MERLQSITVLGGSAASNFKMQSQENSWPKLLEASLPNSIDFKIEIRSGLTFTRAIPILADLKNEDLLIFHFGTSIGWPSSIVATGIRLGINFTNEFGFHQSAFRSANRTHRFKSWIRAKIRNFIKYLLFFTGQYRARVNRREIEDQIEAVTKLAKDKAKRIIWIQHQALHHRSIFLERLTYQRYYKEIERSLQKYKSSEFTVITLPDSFLKQENYLLDCVHLSEQGHREMFEIVWEAFQAS